MWKVQLLFFESTNRSVLDLIQQSVKETGGVARGAEQSILEGSLLSRMFPFGAIRGGGGEME